MMAAQPEYRTVTTNGEFNNLNRFLSSNISTNCLVRDNMSYEHTIYHPHRRPSKHIYRTNCPHQFRLQRRKTKVGLKTSPDEGQEMFEDELVIHLSDSVREMYAEWTMSWEFSIPGNQTDEFEQMNGYPTCRGVFNQPFITSHSNQVEWKTITVGKVMDIQNLLEGYYAAQDTLEFRVSWSRQDRGLSQLEETRLELNDLKRLVARTHTTFLETFRRPLIETTRLVFRSKRNGTVKCLYVPSHILTQFDYFQTCHSPEYSETQNVATVKRKRDQIEKLSKGLSCDDSDDEWDSDSEDVELEKNTTFKATIHVTGTSRQTYQAFIDYAICGALYFAPMRSAYQQYRNTLQSSAIGQFSKEQGVAWHEWAEENYTPHTIVPGFKTLTSPKSLYRLADMLIIPELKAICQEQIIESLDPNTVLSELKSSVFEHHEELRVEAYKFMRQNWYAYDSSDIAPFISSLSQAEAALVFDHILSDLVS
ncbi:hypothetical protein DFH28DRAFT_943854 [Melampsora americana]|nr:hypothetical protein DFH28DRAFT_943854 [Melampsora americana]